MVDTLKSINITNEDQQLPTPLQQNTIGSWLPGDVRSTDGYVTVTATGIAAAAGSTYRLVRFPVNAKIKNVVVQSIGVLDSNGTQTLAIDWNIAFSDSAYDGTSVSNQGLIPTTAGAGATTSVASYSSPNIFWGTNTQSGNNVALARTDITFQGTNFSSTTLTNTLVVPYVGYTNIPIWKIFTFVNAQGYETPPDGYFDVLAYTSVKAATGHAGSLYVKMEYVE
jgi:hypothetical protein